MNIPSNFIWLGYKIIKLDIYRRIIAKTSHFSKKSLWQRTTRILTLQWINQRKYPINRNLWTKKSPSTIKLRGDSGIESWRWPTLTWPEPHYHWRDDVSLLSSGRDQVVPSCYCRQQRGLVMSLCVLMTSVILIQLNQGLRWYRNN